MFNLDFLVQMAADLLRTLLIEEISERVQTQLQVRSVRRLKGLDAVRRHVHRRCRQNLMKRLST